MLTFRYGTVSSGKTNELLVRLYAHDSREHRKAVLVKPALDTRNGRDMVWSRVPGMQRRADMVLAADDPVPVELIVSLYHCVFIDECQFLSEAQIRQFWEISARGIPVVAYGLRADYQLRPFPASALLMTLADRVEPITSLCHFCHADASHNLKMQDGVPVFTGAQVELGCEELYTPICSQCYLQKRDERVA